MPVCRRAGQIGIAAAVLVLPVAPLRAQSLQSPATIAAGKDLRPATTTVGGDTGLWFVPSAEILPAKAWSVSSYLLNADYEEGFTDVSSWPVTLAVGVHRHIELFGAWSLITRIDRDVRPLFSPTADGSPARAGGVLNAYPFVRRGWSGNQLGDLWIGGKINLASQDEGTAAVALAVRGVMKVPTASAAHGAGTGEFDAALDVIVSREINARVEVCTFGGFMLRGDPRDFDLTNGVRWGVGVAMPSRGSVRLTTELHGEKYLADEVRLRGSAGDLETLLPAASQQKSPIYGSLGLTWSGSRGMFAGVGVNWNFNIKRRSELGAFRDRTGDMAGVQLRIGYRGIGRKRAAAARRPAVDTTAAGARAW